MLENYKKVHEILEQNWPFSVKLNKKKDINGRGQVWNKMSSDKVSSVNMLSLCMLIINFI